ncbi:MAG: hypothetical protein Q4G34_04605 [Micrococcus sp.]|nr:hypothetical protein [Micrococcus sp.]
MPEEFGAFQVIGIVFPVVLAVLIAVVVYGARASGAQRTKASDFELRLRETVFTGQPEATLQWPRDRRRPSMAEALRVGEIYGYQLVDREDREHVVNLRFEKVETDEY